MIISRARKRYPLRSVVVQTFGEVRCTPHQPGGPDGECGGCGAVGYARIGAVLWIAVDTEDLRNRAQAAVRRGPVLYSLPARSLQAWGFNRQSPQWGQSVGSAKQLLSPEGIRAETW